MLPHDVETESKWIATNKISRITWHIINNCCYIVIINFPTALFESMIVLYCAQEIMVYFDTYKYGILLLVHCSFPYWSSQKRQLIYNILIPDEMIGLFLFCCLLLFNASQVLSHSEIISLSVFIFFYLFGDFTFFIKQFNPFRFIWNDDLFFIFSK